MVKLWLDSDFNRDPDDTWKIVKTVGGAIDILKTEKVDIISLDYDFGNFQENPYIRDLTGLDLISWMRQENVFPFLINIHSSNKLMAKRMFSLLSGISSFNKSCCPYHKFLAFDLETEYAEIREMFRYA